MSRFGVVIFPGSNCDEDVIHVLQHTLGQDIVRLWHKDTDLAGCDFIILPGGFSFGDYLRSGAIARFSPIMREVINFALAGGYVLGICNGFQVLTESGLLPGALLHNSQRKFECRDIYLRAETQNSVLTNQLPVGTVLKIPIAHGEGNYYASSQVLAGLNAGDEVIFRYCSAKGELTGNSNPNGSLENIAAICNPSRNVFGMMPHPERASDHLLGNTDGLRIFESILSLAAAL